MGTSNRLQNAIGSRFNYIVRLCNPYTDLVSNLFSIFHAGFQTLKQFPLERGNQVSIFLFGDTMVPIIE